MSIVRRSAILILALVILSTVLTGCGGTVGAALKVIGLAALLPDSWLSEERTVKLVADVISDAAILEVVALVTREGNPDETEVIMTRNAEGKYEGSFQVPTEDADVVYTAVVKAVDSTSAEALSESVEIFVPPVEDTVAP